MATSNLTNRWRKAYMTTRRRSIYSPLNSPQQRAAARDALRREIFATLKGGIGEVFSGQVKNGAKKMARSALLGSVYLGAGA